MNEIPTREVAQAEIAAAEKAINFNSPEWHAIEVLLGWERYQLACQVMAEHDEDQCKKYYGMASMCQKLILMGQVARKSLANSADK